MTFYTDWLKKLFRPIADTGIPSSVNICFLPYFAHFPGGVVLKMTERIITTVFALFILYDAFCTKTWEKKYNLEKNKEWKKV